MSCEAIADLRESMLDTKTFANMLHATLSIVQCRVVLFDITNVQSFIDELSNVCRLVYSFCESLTARPLRACVIRY